MDKPCWIYLHTHENNPFSKIFLSDSMFDAWNMVHVDGDGDLGVVYFPYGKTWLAGTEAGFAFLVACVFPLVLFGLLSLHTGLTS